eukprot:TRINITY_DN1468_c0_g1_i1.p1 TRINITY_DN1468_c0_g1~~TRINITY_DN1468_c0_g1_i1.p1  ORF type:complete len:628 (+),score=98.65 TRINITY_DN1468_c0_g1_i1:102-1886(+)
MAASVALGGQVIRQPETGMTYNTDDCESVRASCEGAYPDGPAEADDCVFRHCDAEPMSGNERLYDTQAKCETEFDDCVEVKLTMAIRGGARQGKYFIRLHMNGGLMSKYYMVPIVGVFEEPERAGSINRVLEISPVWFPKDNIKELEIFLSCGDLHELKSGGNTCSYVQRGIQGDVGVHYTEDKGSRALFFGGYSPYLWAGTPQTSTVRAWENLEYNLYTPKEDYFCNKMADGLCEYIDDDGLHGYSQDQPSWMERTALVFTNYLRMTPTYSADRWGLELWDGNCDITSELPADYYWQRTTEGARFQAYQRRLSSLGQCTQSGGAHYTCDSYCKYFNEASCGFGDRLGHFVGFESGNGLRGAQPLSEGVGGGSTPWGTPFGFSQEGHCGSVRHMSDSPQSTNWGHYPSGDLDSNGRGSGAMVANKIGFVWTWVGVLQNNPIYGTYWPLPSGSHYDISELESDRVGMMYTLNYYSTLDIDYEKVWVYIEGKSRRMDAVACHKNSKSACSFEFLDKMPNRCKSYYFKVKDKNGDKFRLPQNAKYSFSTYGSSGCKANVATCTKSVRDKMNEKGSKTGCKKNGCRWKKGVCKSHRAV